MAATNLIKKHERAIEILEAIESFQRQKQRCIESANSYQDWLPELAKKCRNDADTKQRCIDRLHLKHLKLTKAIAESYSVKPETEKA